MRELTANIIDKEVHVFKNKPVPVNLGQFGDGGFPATGGWSGGTLHLFRLFSII